MLFKPGRHGFGLVGFVAAWVIAGARTKGYSPVDDAISLLAATDAPTRWLMTAGFVCFGVAVPLFAVALRDAVPGRAWIAAAVSGLATLGVAAFPLHVSTTIDRLHGSFASIGYIALALVPFLAGRVVARQGHRTARRGFGWSSPRCRVPAWPSRRPSANGLFQRAGLTAVDVWLVVAAVTLLRQSPAVTGQNDSR